MLAILHVLTMLAVMTVLVMQGFGFSPKTATGLASVVYPVSLGLVVLCVLANLWRTVFVNARPTEAADIDIFADPVREFGYRWQRFHGGLMLTFAALFAAPLLLAWPLLWVVAPDVAAHPAVPLTAGFVFLFAVVLFVVGRRCWSARVAVYPDRLAVRGMYSNGSLRWDEARLFLYEQQTYGNNNTMWVYFLVGDEREVRVEYAVEPADEFVREVESRTGLTLEVRPVGWVQPPVARTHEAFGG